MSFPPVSPLYCPHCKAPVTREDAVCPSCGGTQIRLRDETVAAPPPPVAVRRKGGNPWTKLGATVIGLAVGAAVGYYRGYHAVIPESFYNRRSEGGAFLGFFGAIIGMAVGAAMANLLLAVGRALLANRSGISGGAATLSREVAARLSTPAVRVEPPGTHSVAGAVGVALLGPLLLAASVASFLSTLDPSGRPYPFLLVLPSCGVGAAYNRQYLKAAAIGCVGAALAVGVRQVQGSEAGAYAALLVSLAFLGAVVADAARVAGRLRRGESVRRWQWF